jgi:hypothetical protein
MRRWPILLASIPERLLRSVAAVLGGAVHETAEVLLPRFVKRSRLYEATAKNLLRLMGIAFFNAARHVGRQHVLDAYSEDLRPLRREGFGAYAARVSRPYAAAVQRHVDPERQTLTERGIARLGRE